MTVRLSRDEAKRLGLDVPPNTSKYRNVPTVYNGVRYASKREAERAATLDEEVRLGLVRFWIGQPKFRLGCAENVYIADFLVIGMNIRIRVEDVKGVRTPKFNRDVKLWERYGHCDLWIIGRDRIDVVESARFWPLDVPVRLSREQAEQLGVKPPKRLKPESHQ